MANTSTCRIMGNPPTSSPITMLYVYQSNRLEYLAHLLAGVQQHPADASAWATETVMVQSQGMRRYLNQFLAQHHGVAANIHYHLPAAFGWQLTRAVLPNTPVLNPFSPSVLRWRLLALFQSPHFQSAALATVDAALNSYLSSSDNAPYHLAGRLADMFDQYLVYRPDWIEAWDGGEHKGLGADEIWQADLWRCLNDGNQAQHRVAQWRQLLHKLGAEHLPARLLVFGIATLAPMYLQLLQAIARHIDVHVFALNPSSEHWGNVLPLARQGNINRTDSGHPLLASLGGQGRDFFDALADMADVQYEVAVYDPAPPHPTLLSQLQFDIQSLSLPEARPPLPMDNSIQLTAAHSPLRELQILKDQLLQDLATHPDWQPHDIAVLTPHIEPYLPFIDAVFGHSQGGNQMLPYSIADVKISRHQPLLQFLQQWLRWVQSRCELDYLLPMLDSPILRRHFDLSDADVDVLTHAITAQGIRWGSDGALRAHYGGHDHIFTWQHGRERTVMGWLLPQTDALKSWQGVLPWYADINHTAALARGQNLLDQLLTHYTIWQTPESVSGWQQRLRALLTDIVDSDDTSAAMQQLEIALADWQMETELATFDNMLAPVTALEHLQGFLDSSSDAGLLRGGITFCSMVPMRSLPFKYVCLLGLNDGDYPRATKAATFDLIARHPRRGDRARRNDDRYLFLESILSAREKLYLSYIGKDIRKNETLAPSALLNELGDTLAAMTATSAQNWLQQQVCQHPLQAFSSRYFCDHFTSTRQDYADALSQPAPAQTPFYQASSAVETSSAEGEHISINDFIGFWRNPVRAWLKRQLDWQEYHLHQQQSAEEPFTIDNPALLNQNYVAACRHHHDFTTVEHALRQMNALPDGLLGSILSQPFCMAAQRLDAALLHSPPMADANFCFSHQQITISGSLNHLYQHGQIIYVNKTPDAPHQLTWYLRHLIFCAADLAGMAHDTHILYPPQPQHLPPIAADVARTLLGAWLDAYQLGQRQPLPFFAKTSLAAAHAWQRNPEEGSPPEAARKAARDAYLHHDHGHGQESSAEVALIFGRNDTPPIEEPLFWYLINTLLRPLLSHIHTGAVEENNGDAA